MEKDYIYPETYFVTDKEPTIESITVMFLDKANEELSARKTKIDKCGMSVHELLSLASVVQNESLFEEDIPKIAGVFYNRLKKDMPLQSDITVLYALQEKRGNVTYADLEIDSPYNTYKYAGLPPAPINVPPKPCLEAVLNPDQHGYIYFCARPAFDGTHRFAVGYSEHLKNAREFQRELTKRRKARKNNQ